MIHEYSRRRFLIAGGATALALPLLESFGPRTAGAQDPEKRRLVVMNFPNGIVNDLWFPTGGETDFVIGDMLKPFDQHRDDMLIVRGLDSLAARDSGGDPHGVGFATALNGARVQEGDLFEHGAAGVDAATGWGGGVSVDQLVGQLNGKATQFQSLNYSIKNLEGTLWSRMSYSAPGQPVTPEASPQGAFDRVFGAFLQSPEVLAKVRAKRRSILDGLESEIDLVSPRLSRSDALRMQEHLGAIRELEQTVATLGDGALSCDGALMRPEIGLGAQVERRADEPANEVPNANNDLDVPVRHEAFRQLMLRALTCDLTRVTTLMTAPAVSNIVLSWLSVQRPHHELSHEGNSGQQLIDKTLIAQWYNSQVAEMLKLLKEAKDPDGQSLLSRTALLYCSELGNGASHHHNDKPHIIFGQAGGYFKTGRFVQAPEGTAHNGLLVSLCHAMGHDQMGQMGSPEYGTGPLPGMTA